PDRSQQCRGEKRRRPLIIASSHKGRPMRLTLGALAIVGVTVCGAAMAQARGLFFPPDWHPDDPPAMPDVVAHGRPPDVRACGSCHRTEGTGGPENASLAGLPAAYIVEQMGDYKSGARKFAGPQRSPVLLMTTIAKATNDADIQAAAAYFSSLKPKSVIKVVETDTVPATQIARVFYM